MVTSGLPQRRRCRIGGRRDPAGAIKTRTQPFAGLNAVGAGMARFSLDRDGRTDVIPTRKLPDGVNVAIAEQEVFVWISRKRRCDAHFAVLPDLFLSTVEGIAGEVGAIHERAAFESARQAEQVLDVQIRRQQIAARLGNFAFDKDACRVYLRRITVHHDAVPRLEKDVVQWIAGQSVPEVDAQYLQRTVWRVSNQLCGVQKSVWGYISCQVDRITQVRLARSVKCSGMPHFAPHPDAWWILKIVAAEDAHAIQRLKHGGSGWIGQRCRQIETLHTRVVVRRIQPDDLRILGGRLRQKARLRGDDIRQFHAGLKGITAWPQYMSLEVNGILTIRSDAGDVHHVTAL